MRPVEIRTFFEYHYWAFEHVWECIMQLTDQQFAQEINYSTGSIRGLVLHTMSATRRWIERFEGSPLSAHPDLTDYPTRQSVKKEWNVARTQVQNYLHNLSEEKLDQIVHWELPNRNLSADQPLWQVLLHVANHTTDHRAQILALLNQRFNIQTPEQDMLFYLLKTSQE